MGIQTTLGTVEKRYREANLPLEHRVQRDLQADVYFVQIQPYLRSNAPGAVLPRRVGYVIGLEITAK
jgi:hypothetical protein